MYPFWLAFAPKKWTHATVKHGATICLRTRQKRHNMLSHNGLRSNSKIDQEVFIRSQTQSQPAPLKPVLSKLHRQRPTAGSRLGVDTRVGLSPRTQVGLPVLPERSCGGWTSGQGLRAGMSKGSAWRPPGAGLGWGSVAWSGGGGSDDNGQPRIAVTDGSRESQPSGRELLPDLPPRDFVRGGLTDRVIGRLKEDQSWALQTVPAGPLRVGLN